MLKRMKLFERSGPGWMSTMLWPKCDPIEMFP